MNTKQLISITLGLTMCLIGAYLGDTTKLTLTAWSFVIIGFVIFLVGPLVTEGK